MRFPEDVMFRDDFSIVKNVFLNIKIVSPSSYH